MLVQNSIRILTLERNQNHEATIFRLSQNTKLQFVAGSSLFNENLTVYVNFPIDNTEFERQKYHKLDFRQEVNGSIGTEQVTIVLSHPGTFHYYALLNSEQHSEPHGHQDKSNICGYFLVEPILSVGTNATIGLGSIRCQTYLSKCLGYFENWKEKLEVAYRSGYNAIHFTPIQELGGSKSAYSLKNQKHLNPSFNYENSSKQYSFEDVGQLVECMCKEWNIVSFTDIVLNHTANETPWLQEHPESAYNLTNSPHLRPAYLLDRLLWHASLDIESGKWESSGLPKEIHNEEHLNRLRDILKNNYLPLGRIAEMYLVNVDALCKQFEDLLTAYANGSYKPKFDDVNTDHLQIIQNEQYQRFGNTVNMGFCFKQAIALRAGRDIKDWIWCSVSSFRNNLNDLNAAKSAEIQNHLNSAIENVISAVRYERIDGNGPKIPFVSTQHPLVPQYFTHPAPDMDLPSEEQIIYDDKRNVFVMAHNGWVMGDNALKNFAGPDSYVYLRRELIAWGDSVKLRYGQCPDDCPFLWQYMKEYVEQTARIFHGFRLDNCHSTPLEVAEYLIDAARKIRPNLFVIAELFTSSEYLDNIFVNRLGINSLIRESLNCRDSHELGRILHRFGGDPVGAFDHRSKGSRPIDCKPLIPKVAHAILFDQTHDNDSSFRIRTPYDLLPTAALVSMSCSAIGSNRGYDELVPHHIHVVNERRLYTYWDDEQGESSNSSPCRQINYGKGILEARLFLNRLHGRLADEHFAEIFVDQVDFDTVAVTRFNPDTLQSVVLIARTAFTRTNFEDQGHHIRSIHISGRIKSVLFEMQMKGLPDKYKKDDCVINGVNDFVAQIRCNLSLQHVSFVECDFDSDKVRNRIKFVNFKPGSVIAFEIEQDQASIRAVQHIQQCAAQLHLNGQQQTERIQRDIGGLDLNSLNYMLFRLDQEEADEGHGGGTYNVPAFRSFNYCGLAGLMYFWKDIRTRNDLGHPICANLRQGLWLPEYIVRRLYHRPSLQPVAKWLDDTFKHLSNIPDYLVPRYFDLIITPFYEALVQQCFAQCSKFVCTGNRLIQLLTFGSIALVGYNRTAPLPPISDQIKPAPATERINNIVHPTCATIAAGLTHFASGYMRNWGRDTFISLRGLLLTTGRYDEAKYIILAFAGVLRHGLIPNLLDKGINARYNCRDAVWYWLQAIKDYCSIVPDGIHILQDKVNRLYPTDDSDAILDFTCQQPLYETMQEALDRHFSGINFIERNAGKQIDEQMKTEGFNVVAGICRSTGFVYGGNAFNCGTWMDKMGSSEAAGNKGIPATPRNGSAVELVGLSYSVVSWLHQMSIDKHYPYDGVRNQNDASDLWTWNEWKNKIQQSFEPQFWIDEQTTEPLVNRHHIYKDSVNANERWRDFQLRPNFLVTMVVAPELFDKTHARLALEQVEHILVSKLGMITLDPSDWNYIGDYINSDQSNDYKCANGFNYHNGPEWLWPVGYYLRARLLFFGENKPQTIRFVHTKLIAHYQHLEQSEWFGLPELTNSHGKFCPDSCVIQAWSHATLLDVLYDISSQCE